MGGLSSVAGDQEVSRRQCGQCWLLGRLALRILTAAQQQKHREEYALMIVYASRMQRSKQSLLL